MIAEPLQVFTPVFVLSKTVTQLTHRDRGRLSPNSQNADYVLSVRNLIYAAYIFLHTRRRYKYTHIKRSNVLKVLNV